MYKHILVAVALDHGEVGQALLNKARKMLDEGGTIRLLNVIEEIPAFVAAQLPQNILNERKTEAEAALADMVVPETEGVVVDVRRGNPANTILATAETNDCDLIMLASHRPNISDYFIGSTAARVVRHAQCSVLISR